MAAQPSTPKPSTPRFDTSFSFGAAKPSTPKPSGYIRTAGGKVVYSGDDK